MNYLNQNNNRVDDFNWNTGINSKIIIEWYDGIISGLLKVNDIKIWYYISLVYFNKDGSNTYILLPVKDNELKNFLKTFEKSEISQKNWILPLLTQRQKLKIVSWLRELYDNSVFVRVVKCNAVGDEITDNRIVSKHKIKFEFLVNDIDQLMNPDAARNNFLKFL